MMSSSRDRTSTVRMMWWGGNVSSSKEEGEAKPMGQGAPSRKKQEDRGAEAISVPHTLKMLEPVKRKIITPSVFSSGRIHLMTGFSTVMSATVNLSFLPSKV